MDQFAALTDRHYRLFDYRGAPDAEKVIVMMGSGAETAQETVEYLKHPRRKSRPGLKCGSTVLLASRPS